MQEVLKISFDKIRKEKEKMLKKIKDTDILLEEILNYINLISKYDERLLNYYQRSQILIFIYISNFSFVYNFCMIFFLDLYICISFHLY